MEANTLLNDGEKYEGSFVALRSFSEKEVISSGSDPCAVFAEAKRIGADDPVLFFVQKRDTVCIY